MNRAKITLLGTGTCQVQKERMASSVLIELPNLRVVYDMGRGITQKLFADLKFKNNDIEYIVISHFHPDHVSDLIPFLQAASWSRTDPRSHVLHLYGPVGLQDHFNKLLKLYLDSTNLNKDTFKVIIHEIKENNLKINGVNFDFSELPPANNHGLKFEFNKKICAITGDSNFHLQEIDFLKNVDLAIIDAGHPSDEEIVELAIKSQAKIIVCSHLYRELDEKRLNKQAKEKGYRGKLIIGEDLMKFEI